MNFVRLYLHYNLKAKLKRKMKMTANKFKVNRELKQAAPKDLVKKLKSILTIYGAGQGLMSATGLSYPTIKHVAKTGLGTVKTIELLDKAINQIEA